MRRVLLAALIAAACSRDLDVPPPTTRPAITSFSPENAFSGDQLTVVGVGFDPDFTKDFVVFADGNTEQADGFDANGNLLVTVPEGQSGDYIGPLQLQTPAGTSAPSDATLNYLGTGHIHAGTLVAAVPLAHRPVGIAIAGSTIYLTSQTLQAVLGSDGSQTPLPSLAQAIVATASGAVVAYQGGLLRVPDGASVSIPGINIIALVNGAIAIGQDPQGHYSAIPFDDPSAATAIDADEIYGAAALEDGSIAYAIRRGSIKGALVGAAFVSGAVSGPIAANDDGAIFAFDDGTLNTLSGGAWTASASTGSASRIGGIAAFGHSIAYTKPVEGIVGLVGGFSRVMQGQPTAISYSGGSLYVGYGISNAVDALDSTSGQVTRRIPFAISPGRTAACGQGSATDEAIFPARFLFVAGDGKKLLAMDRDSLVVEAPVWSAGSPIRSVVRAPDFSVWIAHDDAIGTIDPDDRAHERIVYSGLTTPPTCLLFLDKTIIAAGGSEITVFGDAQKSVTLPGPFVHGLVTPDGKVLAFYTDASNSPHAQLLSIPDLAVEGTFDGNLPWQRFLGVVDLKQGPMMLFAWDPAQQATVDYGVMLDAQLKPQPQLHALIDRPAPLLSSPDLRYFLWQSPQTDHVVHMVSAADPTAMYEWLSLQLSADVAGPAFDTSGGYLYSPQPDLDQVSVFQ